MKVRIAATLSLLNSGRRATYAFRIRVILGQVMAASERADFRLLPGGRFVGVFDTHPR
jgi:hypothetical protein